MSQGEERGHIYVRNVFERRQYITEAAFFSALMSFTEAQITRFGTIHG